MSYTLTWICGFYRTFESRGIRIAIPMSFITIWDLNPVWSILGQKNANSNHTSKILVDLLQKKQSCQKTCFSHNDSDTNPQKMNHIDMLWSEFCVMIKSIPVTQATNIPPKLKNWSHFLALFIGKCSCHL